MVNWLLVFSLLVTSNVLLTNGFGALSLQRNKSNFGFTALNSVCVATVIIVSAELYNCIYTFLLDPYQLEKLGIIFIVLFAGIFNFIMLELTKHVNKEMYYYYDTTYSFVINLGLTIGSVLCINPLLNALETLVYSSLIALGYFIISILFALVYHRLHNKKVSRMVRPVPITILTMAVLAMIIYAITISI